MGNNAVINRYSAFLFDTPEGMEEKAQVWSVCGPIIKSLLDDFYRNISAVDELKTIIAACQSDVTRLKSVQLRHWEMLLSNDLGDEYYKNAQKIGLVHSEIGLSQDWYMASYAWILMRLVPKVAAKSRFRTNRMKGQLEQILARVFTDMMISTRAYETKSLTDMNGHDLKANNIDNLSTLAETVVSVNATAVHLAQLVGNARDVRLSSQTISSAASQLVASVEQIAVNSESAANEANESNQSTREGHGAVREATDAIGKMKSAVNETQEGIDELSEASNQIGQILSVIEDIAAQTNLLALNATIEAARAGEAGKGFAIVASEVKDLASQTSKSTEDIARRTEALTNGMEKIRLTMTHSQNAVEEGEVAVASATHSMDRISEQVGGVYEKMLDISNILQEQKGATNEIAQSISSVADLSVKNEELIGDMSSGFQKTNDQFSSSAKDWFQEGSDQALCEMAKIDHELFKKRVVDTLMEHDDWTTEKVPDHHSCRLGKWYDGLNRPDIVAHPAYKQLVAPHKAVHEAGREALVLHARGDYRGAIEKVKEMNEASHDVVRLLTELSVTLAKDIEIEEQRLFERMKVKMHAKLEGPDGEQNNIIVEDISQGGVGISGAHLIPGDMVMVSIGNDGPSRGTARWTKGDRAGISFDEAKGQAVSHQKTDAA